MATDGRRIYALGDIHGCREMLDTVLTWVEHDLARRPHDHPALVFVGDYVDRGPDCRGVIDRLIALRDGPMETHFLRGNHDQFFIDYLGPGAPFERWFSDNAGGRATLAAYGLGPEDGRAAARRQVPGSHQAFLAATLPSVEIGDYFFVHAGIDPTRPLADQDPEEVMWMREPFLSWTEPHERIVVHGHTPTDRITHCGNRIAIDTGAVFGGPWSALVLEGEDARVLTAAGLLPVLVAMPDI